MLSRSVWRCVMGIIVHVELVSLVVYNGVLLHMLNWILSDGL